MNFIALVTLLLVLVAQCAAAKEPLWPYKKLSYMAINQDVYSFLKNLSDDSGLPFQISSKLKSSKINLKFSEETPKHIFESLVDQAGLIWYYDDKQLYVYKASEEVSKIIQLDNMSPSDLQGQLIQLNLWDSRFQWYTASPSNVISLHAPPRYVTVVEKVKALLDKKGSKVIRVFKLQHTWASDQIMTMNGRSVTIPGVASLLSDLFISGISNNNDNNSSIGATYKKKAMSTLEGLSKQKTKTTTKSAKGQPGNPAFIKASPRRNAVIIRDSSSNMPIYKKAIEVLDQPTRLVEIRMSIIDIHLNDSSSLGIDWGDKFTLPFSIFNDPIGTFKTKTKDLSMSIEAMGTYGKTKIVSRPSIVTMDNMQAVLNQNVTMHIRAANKEEASVVPIKTGLVLQITPHIVDRMNEAGELVPDSIQLFINIKDGKVLTASQAAPVDNIPRTQESQLQTQSVLALDESIVVGGYYQEIVSNTQKGIPILSKIPLIGALFGKQAISNSIVHRLFIITPRVVDNLHEAPTSNLSYDTMEESMYYEQDYGYR